MLTLDMVLITVLVLLALFCVRLFKKMLKLANEIHPQLDNEDDIKTLQTRVGKGTLNMIISLLYIGVGIAAIVIF